MNIKRYLLHIMIFITAILPFITGSYLLLLKNPLIERDEYVMFDLTQTFMKTGRITSDIYGNFSPEAKNNTFVYPPAYFSVLSAWFHVFGSSVQTQRMFSVAVAFAALLVFYLLVVTLSHTPVLGGVGVFLLSLDTRFGEASRHGRMEILVIFFTLSALLAYVRASGKKNIRYLWLAGIAAGIATMTHVMGFMAVMILMMLVILSTTSLRNKITQWVAIIFPAFLMNIVWLMSIRRSWGFITQQISYQAAQKLQSSSAIVTLFLRHPIYTILFTLYTILLITLIFMALKKKVAPYTSMVFTVLAVSTAFALFGKEVWYVVYIAPFVTLVMVSLLDHRNRTRSLPMIVLTIATTILIAGINLYALTATAIADQSFNYAEYNLAIAKNLGKERSVVCISASPDPSYLLRNTTNLTIHEFIDVAGFIPQKKRFLDSCDYVIVNLNPGDYAVSYFIRNSDTVNTIEYPHIHPVQIIKLKPINARL